MSIDQFTRDAAYFQSRRDSDMLLNAEDMDFQFNNLVDYLNTKIVPMINNFIQGEFIGVNNPVLATQLDTSYLLTSTSPKNSSQTDSKSLYLLNKSTASSPCISNV